MNFREGRLDPRLDSGALDPRLDPGALLGLHEKRPQHKLSKFMLKKISDGNQQLAVTVGEQIAKPEQHTINEYQLRLDVQRFL